MSTAQVAIESKKDATISPSPNALDRLIPTWDNVPIERLKPNSLYLFVTPGERIFATYQGRQNGYLNVRLDRAGDLAKVETKSLDGVFKIGGDITVAEELNKRFSVHPKAR